MYQELSRTEAEPPQDLLSNPASQSSRFVPSLEAPGRYRAVRVWAALALAFLATWLWASHQFPETMHQVRLVMLLIATGGPGD